MEISVVIPVYKAENIVDELIRRLTLELGKITEDYEIILVNDRSPDNSWQKMVDLSKKDPRVKGILLSRNFGQYHAITAGFDIAKGNWIVVMDCDLQDLPEEIVNLYNEAQKGYDIVLAARSHRSDSWFKKTSSRLFNIIFSYLSGVKQDHRTANFGVYRRKVIEALNSIREPMRALPPMAKWVGFSRTAIEVKHEPRYEGKTSYTFNKLLSLAIDTAIAYSDKPLRIFIVIGTTISMLSFIYGIYSIIIHYLNPNDVPGYASLIASIWFLSGLIILILGVVGIYVGKSF